MRFPLALAPDLAPSLEAEEGKGMGKGKGKGMSNGRAGAGMREDHSGAGIGVIRSVPSSGSTTVVSTIRRT